MGVEPKIVKLDPSVSNSAWESIFQMNVDFHFTARNLGFLNIFEYLAKYGIEMEPLVTERSLQSWKKHVLCMRGLLPTIMRGGEQADQESVYDGKIAQVI